ncbi:MAG: Glutamate--tRNA ligase [Thermoleophilia bacterium]|nr:Glutamate--tRNA ligase [Thermoleophilia bacterium]
MATAPHDGRYAPSPTGELHLGNLRTALAAWLFARAGGGRLLLRIDDLDPDRSRPEHEHGQLDALRSLGLTWDGEPVRQSARIDRHRWALDRLAGLDRTYPCFCSRAEVRAAAQAPHGPAVDGAYPGTCARFAPTEAARRVAAGEEHCLRVRAEGASRAYEDLLLGPVEEAVDDFVVRRRDGVPAYNLATVVDDADLGVGEVVRGADLAETTPRQLWLADTLGLPAPRFAHVPLVLGSDGARLAKRNGALGLPALAARGLDADQVRTLLAASLGIDIAPGDTPDPAELARRFDSRRVPREAVQLPV